jgi:sialate O-acetylesterase
MLLVSVNVSARVVLPSIFSDNMVLQQKDQVNIWGKAAVHKTVSITTSWNKKKYSVHSDKQGNWKTKISTPSAGGPYTITFSDGESLTLQNILIGEVWVCSGQSNMEMPVEGFKNQPILHSNDILMEADNPQIRLFRLERAASTTPLKDCKTSSWQESNPETVKKFSALGYQYAKLLQGRLKVPVGIIGTYWGGTMVEAWMSENSLQAFPQIRVPKDTAGTGKNTPAVLFNAMINPLVGYGIKGVIWYQGEQNRVNPGIYDQLLPAMVKEWRTLWKQGEWPFYYVQIAPYRYNDKLGPAAPVREAQLKAMNQIPNSGMVVTMDVGEEKLIHPSDKTTISKRLAYWALSNTYGRKGLAYASPVYQSMKITGDTVTIRFDHAANGLTSFGKELSAFEIAANDQVFYPATAKITGEGIRVYSTQVKGPVAVRYAYKDWVVGDLFNIEGLPVAPFRTDNW